MNNQDQTASTPTDRPRDTQGCSSPSTGWAFRIGDRVNCIDLDTGSGYHGDAYVKRQINHELYEVEDVHTRRRTNVLHCEMTLQHGPDEVSRLSWEAMEAARESFDARKKAEAAAERAKIAAEKSAKAYARLRELGEAVPMTAAHHKSLAEDGISPCVP